MSYVDKIKKYGVEYDIHDTRADYENLVDTVNQAIDEGDILVPSGETFLTKNNPNGFGSFSINRKSSTAVGNNSTAVGYEAEATAENTISMGYQIKVYSSGSVGIGKNSIIRNNAFDSFSIGNHNDIVENGSYIFGFLNKTLLDTRNANSTYIFGEQNTVSDGYNSTIIGHQNTTIGFFNWVLGGFNQLLKFQLRSGQYDTPTYTAVLGCNNIISTSNAVALGRYLKVSKWGQFCSGAYNIEDTSYDGLYKEIFGIGTSEEKRDNGRALDKNGNEYIKGTIYTQCTFPSDGATLPSIKKEVATKDEVALKNAGVTNWQTLTTSQRTNQYILWSAIGQGPGLYLIELAENEIYGNVYTATLSMSVSNQANCFKTFKSTPICANNVSCLKLIPETDGDLVTNRHLSWEDIQFPTNIEKYRVTKLRDYTEYNV